MKLAVQAEFYLKQYGMEAGLARIKALGYERISYTIPGRYDEPLTTKWSDEEIEAYFAPIGRAIKESGLEILYATVPCDVYNDLLPHTTDARRKMCVQAAKAAYHLGAKMLALPMAMHFKRMEAPRVTSKEVTYGILQAVKPVADALGVSLCVLNGKRGVADQCSFGCRPDELLELTEAFGAKVVIDPANAFTAGEHLDEMCRVLAGRIHAAVMTDTERTRNNPFMPMMGCVDYPEVIRELEKLPPDTAAVVHVSPVFRRYQQFNDIEPLNDALDRLLFTMGNTVIGNDLQ